MRRELLTQLHYKNLLIQLNIRVKIYKNTDLQLIDNMTKLTSTPNEITSGLLIIQLINEVGIS